MAPNVIRPSSFGFVGAHTKKGDETGGETAKRQYPLVLKQVILRLQGTICRGHQGRRSRFPSERRERQDDSPSWYSLVTTLGQAARRETDPLSKPRRDARAMRNRCDVLSLQRAL